MCLHQNTYQLISCVTLSFVLLLCGYVLLHCSKNKYKAFVKKSFMQDASINGMKLLPADFLINEDGIIVDIFRADNNFSSRHMPFERIEACFIPESKRCKCYRKDCISPACRAHDNKRATL